MGGKSVAGSTHGHVLVHTAYHLHLWTCTLYIHCQLNITLHNTTLHKYISTQTKFFSSFQLPVIIGVNKKFHSKTESLQSASHCNLIVLHCEAHKKFRGANMDVPHSQTTCLLAWSGNETRRHPGEWCCADLCFGA